MAVTSYANSMAPARSSLPEIAATSAVISVPMIPAAPAVAPPASIRLEQLAPELENAGLILVLTGAEKLADVAARIAAEPTPIRAVRQRPVRPPLDDRPLVQVETRHSA